MEKTIIAFAGSNSKKSINKQLASLVAHKVTNAEAHILDLNNFQLPIYSIDIENEKGIPEAALAFFEIIRNCDGIILSLAEHNGSYTVAFKNVLDWVSRIDKNIFQNKPMLLLATSPGGRGAKTVLQIAETAFPRFGAQIVSTFSLPLFTTNLVKNEIVDKALNNELAMAIEKFEEHIK